MRSTSKLSLLVAASALLASTGCVEYDASMVFDMSFPPLATLLFAEGDDICPVGVSEIQFQGIQSNAGKIFFGSAELNLGDLNNGQPAVTVPEGCTELRFNEPGVFSLFGLAVNRLQDSTSNDGSGLRLDQNLTQITTIKITFQFSTGAYEVERTISKILESGGGGAEFPIVFVNGLGELQLLTQRFQAEAATLGGNIITVPVDVQVIGEPSSGGVTESNVFTFPITMCATCTELSLTPRYVNDG
jgi:hypothetical protein